MVYSLGEITLDSEDAIQEAEAAYNNLSSSEKQQVENADVLEDARKDVDKLVEKAGREKEENKRIAEEEAAAEQKKMREEAYSLCKEKIISTGEKRTDDVFNGYEYAMPVDPSLNVDMRGSIGASETSNDLWLFYEYIGSEDSIKGMKWSIKIDGIKANYTIDLPIASGENKYFAFLKGTFDIETFDKNNSFEAEEIEFEEGAFYKEGLTVDTTDLEADLRDYPEQVVPVAFEMLKYWLDNNELGLTFDDLGIGITRSTSNQSSNGGSYNGSSGGGSSGSSKARTCPNCNGTGAVKTYYGASDLEAYLDGQDPYEIIECPMCHGTGEVTD